MIANISRIKGFRGCEQKEFYREVLRLVPQRTAEPLMTGKAYHAGSAHLFATGNVEEAVALTEQSYRDDLKGQIILEAEKPALEKEIYVAKSAVRSYAEHYRKEEFTVLMPEVVFCVPMPNTEHHCWYAHNFLCKHDPKFAEFVWERYDPISNTGCSNPQCWQPHYFKGRADAVLQWKNVIWLFEQKTSAAKQAIWWRQWFLDIQATGYIYGIWKSTGIRPQGVLLNKVSKPAKNAADPSFIGFEREPFFRTEQDLQRFEKQFPIWCDRYETAMRTGVVTMNDDNCFEWNRSCYYHKICLDHGEYTPAQFAVRKDDYVDIEYYNILNIPKPEEKCQQPTQ